jgi:UDP-GlcNAc:undecaprenyl-phosphate/decaprenyl-phosphate GlcNAc-1-phosphate transferase
LPPEARLGLGLLVALALVYSATPLAIRVADRLQFYDKPAGYKGHARPTPYLGGSAVMVGFLLALFVVSVADWDRTLPLVGGMAVLWAVGTVDDRHNVSPGLRVAFEVVVAAVLWQAGLGWDLGLGAGVDLVLTIVWVVGVVNAFNLFDNMDGAASTMALVVSACAAVLGLLHGDNWLAVAAATLCGACLGFLPHNLASPARIFLGDGGSMPLGFGVASLVMIGAAEAAPASQALVVGVLLVGIPALDTCLVILSRRRRGISILTGGRDHLTHRTHRSLGTARAVAMSLGAVQALVAALALFALRGGATTIVLIVVLYFVAAATAIALLEAVERERERISADALPGLAVAANARKRGLSTRRAAVCALVGVAGAAAGASAFSSGFYSPGQWVPIGLILLVVAIAAAIARSPRLSRPALVALFALGGLGVWALVSSAWAPSIEQATIDANRQIVLAAMFATAVVLVRNELLAAWLTGGIFAGLAAVTVWVMWRLAFVEVPGELLQTGRLNGPLGYVNGMGMVFLMGFWLCFSVVERRTALLSSLGIGAATTMACLGVLTQSRGVAIAGFVSVIAVLAIVPGNRLRRIYGLLFCGAGVLAATPILIDLLPGTVALGRPEQYGPRAVLITLLVSVGAGLAWAAANAALARVRDQRPNLAAELPRVGAIVLVCGVLGVMGAAALAAGRIENRLSEQWSAFVSNGKRQTAAAGDPRTRLTSGSGARYDYWRIAVNAFVDKPLGGVGAGNYGGLYFKERRTTEDIRQPHSIELQTLSELGIVGGGLLAAFLGALGVGIWRMREVARRSPLDHVLMVGGVGVVVAWLVQTSVDWLHLIPGLTAVPLAMAAVMLRAPAPVAVAAAATASASPGQRGPGRLRFSSRPAVFAGAAAAALALVVAVGSLSRQGLADYFQQRAENALADDPLQAIREANRALRLDSEDPDTYYIKAGALARFNQADLAQRTLEQALAKEPDNFVTWTLLGDLAVRRGRIDEAQQDYRKAVSLNPGDRDLRLLVRNPARAGASDDTP